jgi:hypothetical protein
MLGVNINGFTFFNWTGKIGRMIVGKRRGGRKFRLFRLSQ